MLADSSTDDEEEEAYSEYNSASVTLPEEERGVQLTLILNDLLKTDDYSTFHVTDAIYSLTKAFELDPFEVSENALAQLFVKLVQSLGSNFTSPNKNKQGVVNLGLFLSVFGNYANLCPALGIALANHGGVECIIKLLKKIIKQTEPLIKRRLIRCLHNSIRHDKCLVNRSIYRKAGAVDLLKKLLDTSHETEALLTLSYIVDEDESEVLGKDNTALVYLVSLFKKAAGSNDHSVEVPSIDLRKNTYDLKLIANSLSHLIINDANKKVVFQSDGIPVMKSMLTTGFSAEEQTIAAKLLWRLSLDEEVRQSDAIKGTLEALTRLTSSKAKSVRCACKNAVWQISAQYSEEKKQPEAASATSKDSGGHIMISYNWTHQQLALTIRDELETAGYKVWIDVDKMKAAYAYKKKKPVIPLLLEEDYDPQGWLDILIGTKVYYKLYSEEEWQNNIGDLKKAIGRQCRQLDIHADSTDAIDSPSKSTSIASPSKSTTIASPSESKATTSPSEATSIASPSEATSITSPSESTARASQSTTGACSWSNERVLKWFDEIKLPQLKEVYDFCDGNDLKDIYEKCFGNSESFEKECKSSFGLEFKDFLRLKSALRKLFH